MVDRIVETRYTSSRKVHSHAFSQFIGGFGHN